MKICHMTSVHNSHDVRVFYKECSTLAAAGHEVYLVARGNSFEKNDVHVVGVGQPKGSRVSRMLRFTNKVYKTALELNAQVYHIHDPELLPYALKLQRKGKKVIFDSHEWHAMQIKNKHYLPRWMRVSVAFAYEKLETYCVKRIDCVITPCTFGGVDIFKDRAKKSVQISNYPIISNYDAFSDHIAASPCVFYPGAFSDSRCLREMIIACSKADVKLRLAGVFDNETYRKKIESMPEYSCVEYLGRLAKEQVDEFYTECTIGLSLSKRVGQYGIGDILATKVYEYMEHGIPVIIKDTPYIRDVIDKHRFGLIVDPNNVDEIADAIKWLVAHPKEAAEMGRIGYDTARKEFSWSSQAVKLLNIYDEIKE